MKITCTRKHRSSRDIIRERDVAVDRNTDRRNRQDVMNELFKQDMKAVKLKAEAEVLDAISGFPALHLEVNVNPGTIRGLEVTVHCNESNLFRKTSALSWTWESKVVTDENMNVQVRNQTSSWSGLQATTLEQLDSLTQSVECLKVLNNLDWKAILDVATPDYEDYGLNENDADVDSLDTELLESEIEDAMEAGELIRGEGYKFFKRFAPVCYLVLSETSRSYQVQELYIPDITQEGLEAASNGTTPYNVTKNKFFGLINNTCNILEV